MSPIPVFVGPSLGPDHRPRFPEFDWRPPAAAGDLARLAARPPARVCLIDGLFDGCPAPWHKELLLLMEAGTRVYGAASMGALRAAELDGLGMIGVGAIYRAYRDGRLVGDDEVALIHATARWGWAPLSVPMVEFRATLLAARRRGLLSAATARAVLRIVHDIHYVDRDWPAIARACSEVASADQLRRLERMHVPLKRMDALACLHAARAAEGPERRAPLVPRTCFLDALLEEAARPGSVG